MCAHALTGCPARSGSSPAAASRRIASGQRVVIPLLLAAVILRARRSGQRVQYPPDHLGALRREIPVDHPGATERGRQLDTAVGEVPVRILIRQVPAGPLVHLPEQPGEFFQAQTRSRRRD